MKTFQTDSDRAATLAMQSVDNFLLCLKLGKLPGRANARKALYAIRKACQQHRRAGELLGVTS